jgi:SAM-dependent methyltransferase
MPALLGWAKPAAKAVYERLLWARVGMRAAAVRRGRRPPPPPPEAPWNNSVLQRVACWKQAAAQAKRLGLPLHIDRPKNWDTLGAVRVVLDHTDPSAAVLDAGSAPYSTVLPSLCCYGYEQLFGIDLTFKRPLRRGPVLFSPADLTATSFADAQFDAVTCLSVIEHGVNLEAYFSEMARILKPGGVLVTSTDYWCDPIDTRGQAAYGVPVHVFTRDELTNALKLAGGHGLEPTEPVNLDCGERTVRWKRFGLEYTYVLFTLAKRSA